MQGPPVHRQALSDIPQQQSSSPVLPHKSSTKGSIKSYIFGNLIILGQDSWLPHQTRPDYQVAYRVLMTEAIAQFTLGLVWRHFVLATSTSRISLDHCGLVVYPGRRMGIVTSWIWRNVKGGHHPFCSELLWSHLVDSWRFEHFNIKTFLWKQTWFSRPFRLKLSFAVSCSVISQNALS